MPGGGGEAEEEEEEEGGGEPATVALSIISRAAAEAAASAAGRAAGALPFARSVIVEGKRPIRSGEGGALALLVLSPPPLLPLPSLHRSTNAASKRPPSFAPPPPFPSYHDSRSRSSSVLPPFESASGQRQVAPVSSALAAFASL